MKGRTISFAKPPVVEVVAGVVFVDYPPEFQAVLAAFWKDELRSRFPVLQQQPPYTAPEEQFQEQVAPSVSFQFGGAFPSPRLWASTEDGQELIQLQPDWFAHNWRKVKPDDEYDRWGSRRAALARSYSKLIEYLESNGISIPRIRQCEVTYINHISLEGVPDGHGAIGMFLKGQEALSEVRNVEQLTLQTSYRLDAEVGLLGRLHLKLSPALESSGKPVYILDLTARSAPEVVDFEGALSFLDSGRNAINNMFVSLTTEFAHRRWGLEA